MHMNPHTLKSQGGCLSATFRVPLSKSRQPLRRHAICSYTVTLLLPKGKVATFKADSAHSIYDYATYNNVSLPACCLKGSCTSCVGRIVKGRVDQHSQCCLNAHLQGDGYVALCCAVPLSDVTIETHQGPKVRKLRREEEEVAL